MVDGGGLSLFLRFHDWLATWSLFNDLRVVMIEDTSDLVVEDAAKADGATPWIIPVYATGDALRAEGEATFINLWGEETYPTECLAPPGTLPGLRMCRQHTFGGANDL